MNIGNIYIVKECWWLVFPETMFFAEYIGDAFPDDTVCNYVDDLLNAKGYADYWTADENRKTSFISPGSSFVVLEQDKFYQKILTSVNGCIGWIYVRPFEEAFFEKV